MYINNLSCQHYSVDSYQAYNAICFFENYAIYPAHFMIDVGHFFLAGSTRVSFEKVTL